MYLDAKVGDSVFEVMNDSGASTSFMSEAFFNYLRNADPALAKWKLEAPEFSSANCSNGTVQSIIGKFVTRIQLGDIDTYIHFHVAKEQPVNVILGQDLWRRLLVRVDYLKCEVHEQFAPGTITQQRAFENVDETENRLEIDAQFDIDEQEEKRRSIEIEHDYTVPPYTSMNFECRVSGCEHESAVLVTPFQGVFEKRGLVSQASVCDASDSHMCLPVLNLTGLPITIPAHTKVAII